MKFLRLYFFVSASILTIALASLCVSTKPVGLSASALDRPDHLNDAQIFPHKIYLQKRGMFSWLKKIGRKMKKGFQKMGNGIKKIAKKSFKAVKKLAKPLVSKIVKTVKAAVNTAKGMFLCFDRPNSY